MRSRVSPIGTISPNWRHTATTRRLPPSCGSVARCVAEMAKATIPGTLCYYGAFVSDIYDGGPATVGRASTGRSRLHPEDSHESKDPGLFALSNGGVDLSKVPARKAPMRRPSPHKRPDLKASRKRKSRHRNR